MSVFWSEPPDLREVFGAMLSPAFDEAGVAPLLDALATGLDPFWQIAQSNWDDVFDVEHAPPSALRYLAQFSGVELDPDLTDAQIRESIEHPSGFAVGTPAAILSASRRYLTGSRSVIMIERLSGNPDLLYVRTRTDETPSATQVRTAILGQKEAGIILDYAAISGQDYAQLELDHANYAAIQSGYVDYNALQSDL